MPNHLAAQGEESDMDPVCVWTHIPDNLLLMIFSFLKPSPLLRAAEVCKQWHRVALDEFLWKALLYKCWSIDKAIIRAPGKTSWLMEFRRLHSETPMVESEVIAEHRDQVLHVTFSHDGKMFSSCSKDGYVKVWNATYPVSLKYYADMKDLTWKYTQFSQFNETDTLLLVSGVHFGANSTSGEIVVFNLVGDKFELQCRVSNKPYDVFGTWYNNEYLLSGNIHWLGNYTSCSVLWLNKASQALESQHESVVMCLYKFLNVKASSVRTIMVAECLNDENAVPHVCREAGPDCAESLQSVNRLECPQVFKPLKPGSPTKKIQKFSDGKDRPIQLLEVDDAVLDKSDLFGTIEYGNGYRQAQETSADPLLDIPECSVEEVCDIGLGKYENMHSGDDMDMEDDKQDANPINVYDQWCANSSDITSPEGASVSTTDKPSISGGVSVHQSASASSLLSTSSCYSNSSTETASTSSQATNQICPKCRSALSNRMQSDAWLKSKYLIFTMGTKTYTPHQIGIKLISAEEATESIQAMIMKKQQKVTTPRPPATPEGTGSSEGEDREDPEAESDSSEKDDYDAVDHLIELHGHIIGMCISPDQRYLYVNSRPWPKNYVINDPLYPPPIAQEIDIHVIDLVTMEEVGTMHRAHKAYTPNDECFFIFLDVCAEYVASGAENRHGYLWDRHYGVCLAQYPHQDVVNCVAFNPTDQQVLITASDDHTLKVWRSRHRHKQIQRRSEENKKT